MTPLKIPPTPIDLKCVAFDREITVFWVCEELKTPEYSGWYEVESDPPTFTMVVTRQQARFRRLVNGKNYTFKVTAVNQVGKATSSASEKCRPDEDVAKSEYKRLKRSVATMAKDKLLQIRKDQKQLRTRHQVMAQQNKRKKRMQKDEKAGKVERDRVLRAERKKKRQQEKQRRKEEKERLARKKKMDEQRNRVMQNKRRMSVLAKERINKMDAKIGPRAARNANKMDLSMFGKKKRHKTKKKKQNEDKDIAKKKELNSSKSAKSPKQSGKSLLDQNEILQLNRERQASEHRRSKKKKKANKVEPPKTPQKSKKNGNQKNKKNKKKSSRKKTESEPVMD